MTKVLPVTISAQSRRQFAIQLRASGLTYHECAEAMIAKFTVDLLPSGYDDRYVWRDIQTEMEHLRSQTMETAQQYRLMELFRLDQLQTVLWPEAMSGDLKVIDRMIKIMDHRAKLLGLYAPTEVKINDWRTQVLELIKAGKITKDDIVRDYGEEFARAVLESGSDAPIEGRFATDEKSGEEADSPGDESVAGSTSA